MRLATYLCYANKNFDKYDFIKEQFLTLNEGYRTLILSDLSISPADGFIKNYPKWVRFLHTFFANKKSSQQ
jgi:hypothetical protein